LSSAHVSGHRFDLGGGIGTARVIVRQALCSCSQAVSRAAASVRLIFSRSVFIRGKVLSLPNLRKSAVKTFLIFQDWENFINPR
jgi:hypothetical protein